MHNKRHTADITVYISTVLDRLLFHTSFKVCEKTVVEIGASAEVGRGDDSTRETGVIEGVAVEVTPAANTA